MGIPRLLFDRTNAELDFLMFIFYWEESNIISNSLLLRAPRCILSAVEIWSINTRCCLPWTIEVIDAKFCWNNHLLISLLVIMKLLPIAALLMVICTSEYGLAYKNGAPTSTCDSMFPIHGRNTKANKGKSPFAAVPSSVRFFV